MISSISWTPLIISSHHLFEMIRIAYYLHITSIIMYRLWILFLSFQLIFLSLKYFFLRYSIDVFPKSRKTTYIPGYLIIVFSINCFIIKTWSCKLLCFLSPQSASSSWLIYFLSSFQYSIINFSNYTQQWGALLYYYNLCNTPF